MRRLLLAFALTGLSGAAWAAGPAATSWPQAFGNAQHTSSTTATSPSRLKLAWDTPVDPLNSGHTVANLAVGPGGNIFVVTAGSIASVSPSGVINWTVPIGNSVNLSGPAVDNAGKVFVSSNTAFNPYWALALSTNTGAVLQQSNLMCNGITFANQSSPLLTLGGTVYYTSSDAAGASGSNAGCLTNVNPAGAISWEDSISGSQGGPIAMAIDESGVFLAKASGALQKIAPSGSVLDTGPSGSVTRMAVNQNGDLFILTGGTLKALSGSSLGTTLWTYSAGSFDTSLAVSGNLVYVTTFNAITATDHYLVALNATSGAVVFSTGIFGASLRGTWPLPPGGNIGASVGQMTIAGPDLVIPAYNVAYGTSSANAFMIALDTGTGARRWIEPMHGGNTVPGQPVPNTTALYGFNLTDAYSYQASGATSLSVSASTGNLVPEASVTVTATVNPAVSGVSVMMYVASGSGSPQATYGFTNASGQYAVTFSSTSTSSGVQAGTMTVVVVAQDFAPVSVPVTVESEAIHHYNIVTPSTASVGVPFNMLLQAMNSSNHFLPTYPGAGAPVTVSLAPFLTGTSVAGTGGFGVTSLGISNGSAFTTNTYNKIEAIDIHATQQGAIPAAGVSSSITVNGPSVYVVSIPTGVVAGQNFPIVITAKDAAGNQVAGYAPTLALSAVVWNATNTAASGTLSITNVNLSPSGTVTVPNETFSTGGGIAIKVTDSGLGIAGVSSTMTVTQPALTIDHYHIVAATQVTVGLPFPIKIEAMDASSAPVTYNLSRTLSLQAFLAGTTIAGSGSLGVASFPLAASSTFSYSASETYNKIESVQLKVTDDDGRVGISSYTISFTGPTQFVVTVATSAQAGVPFQFVVVAEDATNAQVPGYNGTVSISAVDSANTTVAGAGTLGVTNLNLSGGAGSSAFQSYTKAQGIRFRVADSGVGVTTISSSMTVVAGPAASLSVSANPQSVVASVPSVMTASVLDAFSNPVSGSTVAFSVIAGSGVVSASLVNGVAVGGISTQVVTNASGQAQAFFGSTNTANAQADVVRAQIGSLTADTTIYSAVLIATAGGTIVNAGNPLLSVSCPANTWGFPIRMTVQGKSELSAADLALTTAAFANQSNTFVSTSVMKVSAVRDANPSLAAGKGSKLVTVSLPYTTVGSSITVGAFRGQSLLVPLSVLRVFKLNKQTSFFEMVLDGTNLPNLSSGTVAAEAGDPDGIYALGAPPFVTLGGSSSGTVTTALASGATATVTVPFGSFSVATTLTLTAPSASSLAALPALPGLRGTGIAVSVNTNGIQPNAPVTVAIGYTNAAIAGFDPSLLRIARYDADTGWQILDSQVNTAAKSVTGQTNHFSIFQIVSVSPASSVGSGFAYPNPFRPALGHTRLKFTSLPASAHLKIFTVSGRLLKELDADTTGEVLNWDGTDKDGRALPSGVYLGVVSGTGGKDTIKFAVQR